MTEYFDVVDEDDNIIGKATRAECHSNNKLIHRSVGILVFNSKGELFMQKRSMKKDMNPGKWDMSVSGHVSSGQTYEEAAVREMLEEIGVRAPIKHLFKFKYRIPRESENSQIFIAKYEGPFTLCPEEISDGKFFGLADVKKKIANGEISMWCKQALETYFGLHKK